jgi:predicted CXXCH cytochrome family protein
MARPRALLIVFCLAACAGGEPRSAAPIAVNEANAGEGAGAARPRGQAARAKVAGFALHAAHAAATPPIACDGCHQLIGDTYLRAASWRCASCHEEQRLVVHDAASTDSDARECFSCHDFFTTAAGPRPCAGCHDTVLGKLPAITLHDPRATREDCATCHRAHDRPALSSPPCESCHDTEIVTGHDQPGISISGCASCHGYHEPAKAAASRCTGCHRQSRAEVPLTATFSGHDRCVDCHPVHRFRASDVQSCDGQGQCHAGASARGHRGCTGCHEEHNVLGGRPGCVGCHRAQAAVDHPRGPGDDRGSTPQCTGCHPVHTDRGARRALECSTCHGPAGSVSGGPGDRGFHRGRHEAAPRCQDCHQPHSFGLTGGGTGLCLRCHGEEPFGRAATVRPHAQHADCKSCHGEIVAHQATAAPAACGSCHDAVAASAATFHAHCTDCHEPHSARVAKECRACHETKAIGMHADVEGGCKSCHEPHRGAVQEECGQCHADRTGGIHADVDGGCRACHEPHGAATPEARPGCATCHAPPTLPALHQAEGHDACAGCHVSHGEQLHRTPAACRRCHEDETDHEPTATMCTGCHEFGGSR